MPPGEDLHSQSVGKGDEFFGGVRGRYVGPDPTTFLPCAQEEFEQLGQPAMLFSLGSRHHRVHCCLRDECDPDARVEEFWIIDGEHGR